MTIDHLRWILLERLGWLAAAAGGDEGRAAAALREVLAEDDEILARVHARIPGGSSKRSLASQKVPGDAGGSRA